MEISAVSSVLTAVSQVQLPMPESVVRVAAGSCHSLFLTTSGRVYSCGENSWGSLGAESLHACMANLRTRMVLNLWRAGVGDESARMQPTPVKLPAGAMVLDVAAGGTHSAMILGFGGLKTGSCSVM